MKKHRIDYYRILAILTLMGGILYFYFNLFAPSFIAKTFRIGIIREPFNLLLLGTDITFDLYTNKPIPGSDGRTDSILLLRFDAINHKLNILSIPRDSFVNLPGHGYNKINAAHVFGGINLAGETVSDLTGKKIDYFIEVNPHAAVKIVDLIGGINLYVEKDMYYTDRAANLHINLKQGWKKLSGEEAEGYLRFRHDAEGDIGRIARQQKFMQALFLSFARPTNLIKAPLAIRTALEYVKTDLPLLKTIRLVNFLRMLSPQDLRVFTVPGEAGMSDFAGSIWQVNRAELAKIIERYF